MGDVDTEIDAFFGGQVSGLQRKPTAIDVAVLGRKLSPIEAALLGVVESKYRKQTRSTGPCERRIRRHTTDTHAAGIPRCCRQRPVRKRPSLRIGVEQRPDFYKRNHTGLNS